MSSEYHWIQASDLPIREYRLQSFDGTRLAYQTIGDGPLTVAVCNGLGGSLLAWKHVVAEFRDRCRFVSWDYRGLFNSEPPSDPKAYDIGDHCRDLLTVLEQEKVTGPVVLMGWSMGVQVALEFAHLHPERVRGIVLVNGSYGDIWKTAFNLPLSELVFPLAVNALKVAGPLVEVGLGVMVERPWTMKLIKASGLANRNLDESIFYALAKEFPKFSMRRYMTIMEYLGRHSAEPYLSEISAPTLVVHGEYDLMTPHHITEVFRRQMPNCEVFTVPAGSHYSIIEFPEIVNLRLEKFLRPLLVTA